MNTGMTPLDWTIIVVYLLAVVGLGIAAGLLRRQGATGGEGGHYFLAGNTLAWPVIGLAMFAANISTVHLVSLAEAAYKFGLVFGNFEWMAGFTLVLLSLFFAPLYLRSRVATLRDRSRTTRTRPEPGARAAALASVTSAIGAPRTASSSRVAGPPGSVTVTNPAPVPPAYSPASGTFRTTPSNTAVAAVDATAGASRGTPPACAP